LVGDAVGASVGDAEGASVGDAEGTSVGDVLGKPVGTGVTPLQQSRRVPPAAGQQLPASPIAAHVGCALHEGSVVGGASGSHEYVMSFSPAAPQSYTIPGRGLPPSLLA
jgi:hypothetical protein